MSIVTKRGDRGKTSLPGSRRVYKDNLYVEISGSIDELNSYLGFAKTKLKKNNYKNIVEQIQKDLFLIGPELSMGIKYLKKLDKRISKVQVKRIEKSIKVLENKVKLKKSFYLPGQNPESASLDIARAVARRTERRVVSLNKKRPLKNKDVLIYLNRLSDLLFLLARATTVHTRCGQW
jgi:ATP:cob(I)alamin adenosyltransferase